jgi:hypothetical protein
MEESKSQTVRLHCLLSVEMPAGSTFTDLETQAAELMGLDATQL